MNARDVWCPVCYADQGQPCRLAMLEAWAGGHRAPAPVEHVERQVAARTEAFAALGRGPAVHRGRWRP